MSSVLIVGSGPSGVHIAETLLDRDVAVTMLDVGNDNAEPPLPDADFSELKERLDDPATYFLGNDGRGIVLPAERPRYFSHPPSKDYVFSSPDGFSIETSNFEPLISFATGGLAEAWTGGSYVLNDAELSDFPIDAADLEPHYAAVARRIGISAARDDLQKFTGWIDEYLDPVAPDEHTSHLLLRYDQCRSALNRNLGFYMGRSRVAVLTTNRGDRGACTQLGRCLWGCPRQALYAPSSTIRQLRQRPGFRYMQGLQATHFAYDGEEISSISAVAMDGKTQSFEADAYVLAAGTLCSSKLFLDSIYRNSGRVCELHGLMDNSQFLMPFVSLGLLGRHVDTHTYQFHQLALGIESRRSPEEYVHGQITTLKSGSMHPIAQNLPVDLKSGMRLLHQTHAALGAANVWLHDRRNPQNILTIRPVPDSNQTTLQVRFVNNDSTHRAAAIKTVKRALRRLGCFVPPGMTSLLPRGSSVHYAGTLPMGNAISPFTCSSNCRSHDFSNLFFADGVSFPFLPAKNLTFTLMANASRIGEAISRELSRAH